MYSYNKIMKASVLNAFGRFKTHHRIHVSCRLDCGHHRMYFVP